MPMSEEHVRDETSTGTEISESVYRLTHGRCVECGQQTHIQRFGTGKYSIPLSIPNLVENGRCLLLHRTTKKGGSLSGTAKRRGSLSGATERRNSLSNTSERRSSLSSACSDYDESVISSSTEQPYQIQTFRGHSMRIYSVAAIGSDNGRDPHKNRFITGSWDKSAILWDAFTGKKIKSYKGHNAGLFGVAYLGRNVAGDDEDANSKHGKDVTFLSCSIDKTVRLWNIRTARCIRTYNGPDAAIRSVCASKLDPILLDNNADDNEEEDVDNDKEDKEIKDDDEIQNNGQSNPSFFLTGSLDHTASLWDANLDEVINTYTGHTDWVSSVSNLDRYGRTFLSGSADKTIKLWRIGTGKCLSTFRQHTLRVDHVTNLTYWMFLSCSADKTIKLWDAQQGKCIRTYKGHSYHVSSVASVSSQVFLSASKDKSIKLWDARVGECMRTYLGHKDAVSSIAKIDDTSFVTGSYDRTASLWSLR